MENNDKQLNNTSILVGEMAFIILTELSKLDYRITNSSLIEILINNKDKYKFQNRKWAFEISTKKGQERWIVFASFAGTVLKELQYNTGNRGYWEITEEGKNFLKKYKNNPQKAKNELADFYDEYSKERRIINAKKNQKHGSTEGDRQDDNTDDEPALFNQDNIRGSIYDYLEKEINPYQFQELVKYLFIGMGYRVSYVSPKGPDGGVDIIAHKDILGVEGKIVKIQAKHTKNIKNKTGVGEKDVRELDSLCKDSNSFGIIVSLKGFVKGVEQDIRTGKLTDITLIDSDRFVDLWTEHLDSIPEEGKKLFPLKKVYIVDNE